MTNPSSASATDPPRRPSIPPELSAFWGWPTSYLAPLAAALGAAILPLSLTDIEGLDAQIHWITSGWWTFISLVALVGGGIWMAKGATKRDKERRDLREALDDERDAHDKTRATAKDEAGADLTHILHPLIYDIANLVASSSAGHGRDLVNRALGVVTKLVAVPRVRACLYRLDHVEAADADRDDIPNSLTLRSPHDGRLDSPRQSFVRGYSDVDDAVFKVLDDGKTRLVEDVDNTEEAVDCEDRAYKTFFNVPVKFKTQEIGVLSVDAPESGSLTPSHVLLASLVAQLMAVGIYREKRMNRDRTPDAPPQPANATRGESQE